MDVSESLSFFSALLTYEIDLWNRLDEAVLAEHGIALGRLRALEVVQRHGGSARVNEVSNELRMTVGAASKMVDRLESDGLVRRSPNPDDRRSSLIGLTPTGAGLVQSGMATFEHELVSCLPAHSHDEVARLTDSLSALHAYLQERDRGSVAAARS